MTEPTAASKIKPLEFRDRKIELKIPGSAQMMMWERTSRQFGKLAESDGEIDKEEFRKALNRLASIVLSMFAQQQDKDWFEDEILEGNIVDNDLLELFNGIGTHLSEQAQGQTKKKAARRVEA